MWRSLGFECPIRLVRAEPVEPDPGTAALLLRTFGAAREGEQRWLLYLAEGSVEPPAEFGSAPAVPLVYAGPLDEVQAGSELEVQAAQLLGADDGDRVRVRVRLAADRWWQTSESLWRRATVAERPMMCRYVSLVADRFDAAGMRVERVAGARCTVLPFELGKRLGWVVDVEPLDGLWWWMVPGARSWCPPSSGTVTGVSLFQPPAGSIPAGRVVGDGFAG